MDAPMTTTNASPSFNGTGGRRARKFTPQTVEKIKELVAQGVSRHEIANLLDVTVGSLQVTCSKLGISLRRNILHNGSAPRTLDGGGRTIPTPGSVRIVHAREHKTEEVSQAATRAAPLPKYAITMRHRGKEVATDIPLTSRAIERLALESTFRDLGIAQLVGQILVEAIKKDMTREILRDEVPPSGA